MSVIYSDYRPSFFLRNGHVHTIYASFARSKLRLRSPRRERIETKDSDFIDVDWYEQSSKKVMLISHGLEGHTDRPYVRGMAKAAFDKGWDVLAWNYRSCSGVPNRRLQSYHSGCTEDLAFLISRLVELGYEQIALCGFSIGGNKTLKYLGSSAALVPSQVIGAITFSVPCDLVSSAEVLAKRTNRLYMRNFLNSLEDKLRAKQLMFKDAIDLQGFERIKTFAEYDERYTAPINGFNNALDYWQQSSSLPFIKDIRVPTALFTSLDDPFLSQQCFPYDAAKDSETFHLFVSKYGGHVGFVSESSGAEYWSEEQGMLFLEKIIVGPSK